MVYDVWAPFSGLLLGRYYLDGGLCGDSNRIVRVIRGGGGERARERAGGRAGGRAGVSFSRVHGTGAGHHPGAGTKARFFHECNRAHATGAGNKGPVLPRVQSRTRYRGQRLGRWRRCLATVGDRRDAHPRAREGKGKEGTKDGGPCMCCSRSICCYRKKRTCCGRHRSSSCAVWFVFFCCWYCFSILVTTGGWLGWSGRGGAGRRTQKNSEA